MKTSKAVFQLWGLVLGAILLGHSTSALGATATVLVGSGGLKFVPAVTNISTGDTVTWSWAATAGHTSTSGTNGVASGLWDSGAKSSGQTFSLTFTNVGSFSYYCIPHASSGMTGAVMVAAVIPTATVQVGNGGLTFTPSTVTLPVNGRVIWTWFGSGHSTTSGSAGTANGLWDSGVKNTPFSYTNTFTNAATFAYYCTPHASFGMTGSVIVTNLTAPNVPPTVTITNPASGVTLSAPASLTLKANATDSDGTIASVQFLQGATSLGSVTSAPFSLAVNNLAAANYTFSAIATDNSGAAATNSITVKVINANPVAIGTTSFVSANHFQFSYNSDIGLTYLVLVSSNLFNWTPLNTNTATVNPTIFTDPNANSGGAFYRVGRLPNP